MSVLRYIDHYSIQVVAELDLDDIVKQLPPVVEVKQSPPVMEGICVRML